MNDLDKARHIRDYEATSAIRSKPLWERRVILATLLDDEEACSGFPFLRALAQVEETLASLSIEYGGSEDLLYKEYSEKVLVFTAMLRDLLPEERALVLRAQLQDMEAQEHIKPLELVEHGCRWLSWQEEAQV